MFIYSSQLYAYKFSDSVMTPYILILSMESKRGNVANQREHLILLLANMDVRNRSLDDYTTVKA